MTTPIQWRLSPKFQPRESLLTKTFRVKKIPKCKSRTSLLIKFNGAMAGSIFFLLYFLGMGRTDLDCMRPACRVWHGLLRSRAVRALKQSKGRCRCLQMHQFMFSFLNIGMLKVALTCNLLSVPHIPEGINMLYWSHANPKWLLSIWTPSRVDTYNDLRKSNPKPLIGVRCTSRHYGIIWESSRLLRYRPFIIAWVGAHIPRTGSNVTQEAPLKGHSAVS